MVNLIPLILKLMVVLHSYMVCIKERVSVPSSLCVSGCFVFISDRGCRNSIEHHCCLVSFDCWYVEPVCCVTCIIRLNNRYHSPSVGLSIRRSLRSFFLYTCQSLPLPDRLSVSRFVVLRCPASGKTGVPWTTLVVLDSSVFITFFHCSG